jgi:hypothetical protein
MLNLGSHTRLFTISRFVSIGQWTIPAHTLIGKVPPVGCDGLEKLPLILNPVSAIAVGSSLIAVQEVWQLLTAMHRSMPGDNINRIVVHRWRRIWHEPNYR